MAIQRRGPITAPGTIFNPTRPGPIVSRNEAEILNLLYEKITFSKLLEYNQ